MQPQLEQANALPDNAPAPIKNRAFSDVLSGRVFVVIVIALRIKLRRLTSGCLLVHVANCRRGCSCAN